jgi:hypothetical protein
MKLTVIITGGHLRKCISKLREIKSKSISKKYKQQKESKKIVQKKYKQDEIQSKQDRKMRGIQMIFYRKIDECPVKDPKALIEIVFL